MVRGMLRQDFIPLIPEHGQHHLWEEKHVGLVTVQALYGGGNKMKKVYIVVIVLLIISNIMALRKVVYYKLVLEQQAPLINEINSRVSDFYIEYKNLIEEADIKFGGNNGL